MKYLTADTDDGHTILLNSVGKLDLNNAFLEELMSHQNGCGEHNQ